MATETSLVQQLLNLFGGAFQPIGGAGGQKALRTITQEALRTPVNEGSSVDLGAGSLDLTTTVSAAWDLHIVAVRFDNAETREVRVSLVMGGLEYHLVRELAYSDTYVVVTDKIRLNAGDQVRVYANGGQGQAHAEIRGELR